MPITQVKGTVPASSAGSSHGVRSPGVRLTLRPRSGTRRNALQSNFEVPSMTHRRRQPGVEHGVGRLVAAGGLRHAHGLDAVGDSDVRGCRARARRRGRTPGQAEEVQAARDVEQGEGQHEHADDAQHGDLPRPVRDLRHRRRGRAARAWCRAAKVAMIAAGGQRRRGRQGVDLHRLGEPAGQEERGGADQGGAPVAVAGIRRGLDAEHPPEPGGQPRRPRGHPRGHPGEPDAEQEHDHGDRQHQHPGHPGGQAHRRPEGAEQRAEDAEADDAAGVEGELGPHPGRERQARPRRGWRGRRRARRRSRAPGPRPWPCRSTRRR